MSLSTQNIVRLGICFLGLVFILITSSYLSEAGLIPMVLHAVYGLITMALFVDTTFGTRHVNLVAGGLFGPWWLFNLMGFARLGAIAEFADDRLIVLYLVLLVATAALTLGYLMGRSFRGRPRGAARRGNYSWVLPSFGVLLVLAMGSILIFWHFSAAGGFLRYASAPYAAKLPRASVNLAFVLRNTFVVGASYLAWAVIFDSGQKLMAKAWAVGYLIMYSLFVVASGGTGALIGAAATPFAIRYARNYGELLTARRFLALLVVLAMSVWFAAVLRQVRGEGLTALNHVLRSGGAFLDLDEIVRTHTFDLLENTLRIMDHYRGGEGAGSQFLYPLVNLVPRALFPAKPEGLGAIIVRNLYGAPPDTAASFVPGVVGEFFYDFGLVGAILAMAFCGLMAGLGARALEVLPHPYGSAVATHIGFAVSSFANSYTGAAIRVEFALLFWGLLNVSRYLVNRARRAVQQPIVGLAGSKSTR